MNRIVLALILILGSGAAIAQAPVKSPAASPTASTDGTAGTKLRLQSLHYGNVQGLRRGPDGQWTGKATRNGIERNVTVSPSGTVTAR